MSPSLSSAFTRQFMHPNGPLGALAGQLMARKNRQRILWAVGEMNIPPGQHVLEIGYGPGVAIEEINLRSPSCQVTGIDPSTVMHAQASRRNRKGIEAGAVRLRTVPAQDYDGHDGPFDLVFAINALPFCPDPPGIVAKTVQWLNPGGRWVIVHQIPLKAAGEALIEQRRQEFSRWLEKGGLSVTRTMSLPAKPNPVLFIEASQTA